MILTIDTSLPLNNLEYRLLQALLAVSDSRGGTQAPAPDPSPSEAPSLAAETPSESSGPDPELLEEAIKRATKLIKASKGDDVRAALSKAGVSKVTQLTNDETLRAFLADLPCGS